MSFKPCACAGHLFPSRPSRPRLRTYVSLALLIATPGITACEWNDDPPPVTAAAAAGAPPSAQTASADPNAPLPPGAPIPPPQGSPPQGSLPPADDAKYASGEYAIGTDADSYDDSDPSALKDLRQPLDPYGTWVDDSSYGTIWVPSSTVVGPDFQPYVSAGHWTYDDDYVWVSDYPWGWAPFHYGRWVFIEGRGWSWIPGREYRGAWVTWSVDDGYSYLGWAPMGPTFVWFGGAAVGWHGYWGPRWAYCPRGAVFEPRVGAHVVVGPAAVAVASRMRPYAVADVRVGPPPARFGYTAAQVPHASAAVSVTHAQQFARPSTARPLGATAPAARFEAAPVTNGGRPAMTGARPMPGVSSVPRPSAAPGVGRVQAAPAPGRGTYVAPAPAVGATRPPASTYHSSGGSHGGGGHHH